MQDGMRNSILAPFRHPDSLPASLARDRINWPHAIFTGIEALKCLTRDAVSNPAYHVKPPPRHEKAPNFRFPLIDGAHAALRCPYFTVMKTHSYCGC